MWSRDDLARLATQEFSAVLAGDGELQSLIARRYDRALESRLLLEVMNLGEYRIGALPVRPLTAAKWAFLWLLENPFVSGEPAEEIDLDVALYVLSRYDLSRDVPLSLPEIPTAARGMCRATGLADEEIKQHILDMIGVAFAPLAIFPADDNEKSTVPHFDGRWITRVCSIATRESNLPFDEVMYRQPLSLVCQLYATRAVREAADPNAFIAPTPIEVEKAIERRIDEVAENYLSKF